MMNRSSGDDHSKLENPDPVKCWRVTPHVRGVTGPGAVAGSQHGTKFPYSKEETVVQGVRPLPVFCEAFLTSRLVIWDLETYDLE